MANVSGLERSIRLSIAEGALATVMGSLTSGVFLTGFALALGASDLQIGMLAALPSFASIAQLLGSYLVERDGRSKPVCMWASIVSRIVWLPILAAPWFAGSRLCLWGVLAFAAVSCIFASIGGVAWLSWVRALIPSSERIDFFGRRSMFNTALSLSLAIIGGMIVDAWDHVAQKSVTGFSFVFAIGMALGLVGLGILSRIPEPACPLVERPPFHHLVLSLFQQTSFRRLVSFYTVWNLASQMAAPFFAVYMLQNLHLPFWFVTFVSVLASVAGILATNFWGRLTQRFGIKPVIFLATLGDALIPLAWLFVDSAWSWVLIPIHLTGVFNAPLTINRDNLVLKLAPERNGTPYMAMFNAVIGPAAAAAAILGGFIATEFAGVNWSLGAISFGGLKIVFLISFLGRLASLFILRGVVEPESESVVRVARVLNRARRRWRFRPAPLREAA